MDLKEAAKALEDALAPLFGDLITVTADRGISAKFEREPEEAFYKRQITKGYREEDLYVSAQIGIIPSGTKFDLKLLNKATQEDTLKSLGITFRRSSVPTLEKAVETVTKWFKANATKLKEASPTRKEAGQGRRSTVVIGTDGVVDYVQVPEGQRFTLGPVSVLRLITGLVPSQRIARQALDEFLSKKQVMVSVDLDQMWAMLPYKRSRYSSVESPVSEEPDMKKASFDQFNENIEMVETIVSKVAATNESIDRLVAAGKRFNATRAKGDLLKIASRVEQIAADVDLAESWVSADLGDLHKQATAISDLFPKTAAGKTWFVGRQNSGGSEVFNAPYAGWKPKADGSWGSYDKVDGPYASEQAAEKALKSKK